MESNTDSVNWRNYAAFASYTRQAIALVWSTHRPLTITMAIATIAAGLLPAAAAKVGQLIVDAVVASIDQYQVTGTADYEAVLWLVGIEGMIVIALMGAQRGIDFCRALLRVLLSQRVNTMILEKALTLELSQFEDSEFYDKLNRARQEASSRPLGLVNATFALARNAISLIGYAALLIQFSVWAVVILVLAGIPVFLSEVKFSGEKFQVFRWRSQERRMLMYLEIVLAREDHAKEVQLFNLGDRLLGRYRHIQEALRRRAPYHRAPRHLGFPFVVVEQCRLLRGVRMDRVFDDRGHDNDRSDDDVSDRVQTRPVCGICDPELDRWHVRRQFVSFEPVRISRAAGVANRRGQNRGCRSKRRSALRACVFHLPRIRATRAE
jgi:ABC-type multidrug transport system fused ATPase/permease subunit